MDRDEKFPECESYCHPCKQLYDMEQDNAELTRERGAALREVGKISAELGKKDAECDRLREALEKIVGKSASMFSTGYAGFDNCITIARKAINYKGE